MARILVIEDNPTNMKLASLILEHAGHNVLTSNDAVSGIAMARALQPDLILMDIQLPGMDGLAATQTLKQDTLTKHIKIVALTAFAMRGDEERILSAGCDGYISKPIHHKDFIETIGNLLNLPIPMGDDV